MAIRGSFAALFLFLPLVFPGPLSAAPPADGWVVWQSNRADSRFEVYRARADGSEVTRMTTCGAGFPSWAPDGRWIAYQDNATAVFLMRPDGSEVQALTTSSDHVPFWLHDNSGLAIQQGTELLVFDPETKEGTLLLELGDLPPFADGSASLLWNALTWDNRYLLAGSDLYLYGYSGANGSITSGFSAVIVDLLHRDKVYWFGSGCWPFSPPAGDLVFHICGDCPTHPDIYHMSLADLATRASYAPEVAHADADWGHEYNPRVSNDNRWLVYMASAGCHDGDTCDYDIWLHEIGAGPTERSRITKTAGFDGYPSMYVGPVWQPASQPRLLVTPNRVTFFASASATPGAQTLKLKNSGTGSLNPATVTVSSGVPGLIVALGGAGIAVGLSDLSNLTRGTYHGDIVITVDGALNSPVTVPVTLIADDSFPTPEAGAPDTGTSSMESIDSGVLDANPAELPMMGSVDAVHVSEANPAVADASAQTVGLPDASVVPVTGKKDGGCGCHVGTTSHAAGFWTLPLAGLLVFVLRPRRRRS
jgi:MYXO-CTERM domain-containing protein